MYPICISFSSTPAIPSDVSDHQYERNVFHSLQLALEGESVAFFFFSCRHRLSIHRLSIHRARIISIPHDDSAAGHWGGVMVGG
jgi:hypothetical protein